MNFELTDEQEELLDKMKEWFYNFSWDKPYYSYSGPSGSGKTSVIKCFIENMQLQPDEVASAAYTGKAVSVLISHDLAATTIHSLIYNTYTEVIKELSPNGDFIQKLRMRHNLKIALDPRIRLIVIDEATMVNDKMKDEILSFNIPTVFIGDNNQLPPIFGISSVMLTPDYTLTKIMRQSENDPIVQLSQRVLHDEPLYLGQYGLSKIIPQCSINESLILDYDMILCAKNKTREFINTELRQKVLKIDSPYPQIGETLICTQNNWEILVDGIFLTNGLVGKVIDTNMSSKKKNVMYIDFQPEFMKNSFTNVDLDKNFISLPFEERSVYGISKSNKFEYGYAITVHKSQGSEADRVLFIDEFFHDRDLTKKLRYTAITRAKKQITIVSTNARRW